MRVDFAGLPVRCDTNGRKVCLNDLVLSGNKWRAENNLHLMTLQQVATNSVGFAKYKAAASRGWGIPEDELLQVVGRGRNSRTMAHISLAIYIAEQMSPDFHVLVIKTFIEGKLLEFRELGGTEFKDLNAAIDLYLPGREGKDNKGCYINAAKILRGKILGADAEADAWATANVGQTHARYEQEKFIVNALRQGLVRDWEHLKELLARPS